MKKLLLLCLFVILALTLSHFYNNFFSKGMLVGRYVNRNYNYPPLKVEIPYVSDTLTLLKNNKFESGYWGNGSYTVTHTLGGTEIELTYNYKYGRAGYETDVKRLNFGTPKIILDRDRNHYYEKIK